MQRFRIFEDSAPFSLVIKHGIHENTSSEQQPFHWDPRFHIGCRGLGRIQPLTKKQSEGKALEVTTALLKVEQESRVFGTVSETQRTQH